MKNTTSGKAIFIIAITAITIMAVINLVACKGFIDNRQTLDTFLVTRGNIIQTVSTSGNIYPTYKNSYSLKASGDVLSALKEGDSFKKGDILIEIDSSKAQLLMNQAEESVKSSKISLDLARISYRQALDANHIAVQLAETNTGQAELSVRNAYKSLESANDMAAKSIESAWVALKNSEELYEMIAKKRVLTDIEKEQYEANIESVQAAYESAKAQAQSSKYTAQGGYEQSVLSQSSAYWTNLSSLETAKAQIATTAKNIEQAETQLELARINLELIALDSDSHIIYAPYDGTVISSAYRVGEYASPGIPAIEIASSRFVIISEVNETDIVDMEIGQEADITLDAYYLQQIKGRILKISPVPTNIGGVVSYKITVELEDQEKVRLLNGLSASLNIITSETEDILYIPIEAVCEKDGKQCVYLLSEDGTIQERQVVTGIFNYDYIEIKEGLSEGDTVMISGFGEEGSRVSIQF